MTATTDDRPNRKGLSRVQMAWRAAQDIPDGAYVNLGIGIPELVAAHVPAGREVVYHTENGILGFGPARPGEEDPDLINAGKKPVTLLPGASLFHHADSFAMIRGGHIDYCILGAMQVAANGDIANWSTGAEGAIPAVGGAMDLVAGVRHVLVITEHTTREGEPKLMERCSYPLTAPGVVRRVFTSFGVIDVTPQGFLLREIAPGVPLEQVRAATAAPLAVA
ncbi:MAG: 3-oxoacid CoA-transferase subunit B, partial [Tistlia sp.]